MYGLREALYLVKTIRPWLLAILVTVIFTAVFLTLLFIEPVFAVLFVFIVMVFGFGL